MKLVSILIPAYNAERWIGSAIRSALDQTWKNVEVVVVDDGSTDGTLAAANQYKRDNVLVIGQENRGAAAARNRALAASSGAVIQYLDADDLLAPDKIERQMMVLGDGVLCSGEWAPFFQFPDRARFVQNALCQDLPPVDWLVTAWTKELMMQPGAWLMERDLALRAGPWDERLSLDDDGEYFTRVILASRKVRFCSGARTYYRIGNANSLSWAKSAKAIRSSYLAATLSTERLLEAERSPRTMKASAEKLMSFVYNAHPQETKLIEQAEHRIREFGMRVPQPKGGVIFSLASRLIGWRAAKKMRFPYYVAKLALAQRVECALARLAATSIGFGSPARTN